MKLVTISITAIALLALSLTNVNASDRRVGGLVLGGGTGAIVGQAIGRNAESTIVGATVGGVLGFIIGNELDRHHGPAIQQPQVVVHSPRYETRPRPVFRDRYRNHYYPDYPLYRDDNRNCKKIVTIEKRHHKTKRVVSTICKKNQRNNYRNHYSYR